VPIEVETPWPGCTAVLGGRLNSCVRIESMIVSKSDSGQPVRPEGVAGEDVAAGN